MIYAADHCGNGTIGCFWDDPDVFVASLHADPDLEYPYTCGFAKQVGGTNNPAAVFKTHCAPLAPGTVRKPSTRDAARDYSAALDRAVELAKVGVVPCRVHRSLWATWGCHCAHAGLAAHCHAAADEPRALVAVRVCAALEMGRVRCGRRVILALTYAWLF